MNSLKKSTLDMIILGFPNCLRFLSKCLHSFKHLANVRLAF